jgi:hypothetical protein
VLVCWPAACGPRLYVSIQTKKTTSLCLLNGYGDHRHVSAWMATLDSKSLRENRALPCVKNFAVRFLSGARQRHSLRCVFPKAHGTHLRTVITLFAVCFLTDARQTFVFAVHPTTDARQSLFTNGCKFTPVPTLPFAVRYNKRTAKTQSLPCVLSRCTANIYLCRVFCANARQRIFEK